MVIMFQGVIIKLLFWFPILLGIYFFLNSISIHGLEQSLIIKDWSIRFTLSFILLAAGQGIGFCYGKKDLPFFLRILSNIGCMGLPIGAVFSFIYYFSISLWLYWCIAACIYLLIAIFICFYLSLRSELDN